jgi:hypothetical protein
LRQLKQRVALRCEVGALELSETAAYIAARIRTAGGVPSKLFTREGVSVIHEYSGGIPRTISVICDNALVTAMALERQPVDQNIVLEVCRDFHLRHNAGRTGATLSIESEPEADTGEMTPPEISVQPTSNAHAGSGMFGSVSKPRRFTLFGSGR